MQPIFCKDNANREQNSQACLSCFAEVQPIFCKDNTNQLKCVNFQPLFSDIFGKSSKSSNFVARIINNITTINMKTLSRNAIIGYPAGIITGITYGLNPLFAVPLMKQGASVDSILFFRYLFAVILLGAWLMIRKHSFSISLKRVGILAVLVMLFTSSSLLLFASYNYIASGLATTIVFLYPVIVAIIMVFLRVIPSWQVWLAIVATFAGVIIMTQSNFSQEINSLGILLSLGSATAYSLFIVIINRSTTIAGISNSLLTFYALSVGAAVFFVRNITAATALTQGISCAIDWMNLVWLALLPTIVSTATLAIATRNIGATKASVMGVFEPVRQFS